MYTGLEYSDILCYGNWINHSHIVIKTNSHLYQKIKNRKQAIVISVVGLFLSKLLQK